MRKEFKHVQVFLAEEKNNFFFRIEAQPEAKPESLRSKCNFNFAHKKQKIMTIVSLNNV